MTRRILVLRHGRTAWNASGRAQGHTDIGLDDLGRAQAASVAPCIAGYRPTVLWSSDLSRASETAAYVADACGLPVRVDARLREYAVGDNRQARTLAEYRADFPAEHADLVAGRDHLVPGRETDDDVRARFVPALTDLAASLGPGGCGVAVTHGHSLRTGLAAFLGWPDGLGESLGALGNCAWAELAEAGSALTGAPPRWRLAAYGLAAPSGADFASPDPVG